MRRIHREVIGQHESNRRRRAEHLRARAGSASSAPHRSVRPTAPTISEPPENNATGAAVLDEDVGMVVGCVTGRRHGDQFDTVSELDVFAVGDRPMRRFEMRRAGATNVAPVRSAERRAAGDVVGVRVRVECPRQSEAETFDESIVGDREARRVDDQRRVPSPRSIRYDE